MEYIHGRGWRLVWNLNIVFMMREFMMTVTMIPQSMMMVVIVTVYLDVVIAIQVVQQIMADFKSPVKNE